MNPIMASLRLRTLRGAECFPSKPSSPTHRQPSRELRPSLRRGRLKLDIPLYETFANLQRLLAERLRVEPLDGYARVEYEYLFFRHLITSSAPTHLLPSASEASLSISATAPSTLTGSRLGRSFLSSSSTDLSTAARSSSLQFM